MRVRAQAVGPINMRGEEEEEKEAVVKKVQGILNRITPEKYDVLDTPPPRPWDGLGSAVGSISVRSGPLGGRRLGRIKTMVTGAAVGSLPFHIAKYR